jgi:drug/metabolite transporter (DMT)-like permease
MNWQVYAILTPLLFVLYQALSKTLPKGTSSFLVNAYASLVGAAIMFCLFLLTSQRKSPALHGKTLLTAIGIGALISLGNYGIIKAYSLGASQSLFTSIFYVTLIIYGVIFGLLIWHEKLHAIQVLGLCMAVIGIFIAAYFRK